MIDQVDTLETSAEQEGEKTKIEISPINELEVQQLQEKSEIAKLREKLGLPEKSPLLDPKKQKGEKEEMIKKYLEEKEKHFFEGTELMEGFIDRRPKYSWDQMEKLEERIQNMKNSRLGKIGRFTTVQTMKLRGIKNPEEILSVFEKHDVTLASIGYSYLRNARIIEQIKQIPNLEHALTRINKLGYVFEGLELASPGVALALKSLSEIPEDQFEKVCEDLNRLLFLNKWGGITNFPPGEAGEKISAEFKTIVDIFQNGGLREEQRRVLEKTKRLSLLTGFNLYSDDGKDIETYFARNSLVGIENVLNNKLGEDKLDNLLLLAEDATYGKLKEGVPPEDISFSRYFYSECNSKLFQTGEIGFIKNLIGNGWDCSLLYDAFNHDVSYMGEQKIREAGTFVKKATEINSDPEKLEWAALFGELIGHNRLIVGNEMFYENIYQKKDFYYGIMQASIDLGADLKDIMKMLPTGEFIIYVDKLGELLEGRIRDSREKADFESTTKQEHVELKDQEIHNLEENFWNFMRIYMLDQFYSSRERKSVYSVDKSKLELLSFLFKNKERFGELFVNDSTPKAQLINELLANKVQTSPQILKSLVENCDDMENIHPDLLLHHWESIPQELLIKILSNPSESFIAKIPQEERPIYEFIKQALIKELQIPIEFLLKYKEKASVYFKNGSLQPQFFCDFLQKSIPEERSKLKLLLTDDVLSNFPEDEREFWTFVKDLNLSTQLFLAEQRQLFNYFFKDGKPTVDFFNYAPQSVLDSSLELLTPEVLASFSRDQYEFWRFYSHDTRIEKDWLRKEKDNFSRYFKNEQPTIDFFEEAPGKISEYVLDVITPQFLEILPKEQQEFWKRYTNVIDREFYMRHKNYFKDYFKYGEFQQSFITILMSETDPDKGGFTFGKIMQALYSDRENKRDQVPIGLCAWRVWDNKKYNPGVSPEGLNLVVADAKREINKKLQLIHSSELSIPEGMRVSMGVEIEILLNGLAVTRKVSKEDIINYQYSKEQQRKRPSSFMEDYLLEMAGKIGTAKAQYQNRVQMIDKMGVGRGKDAIHEFAPNPVDNYTTLLWELYEVSRLGFLDFDRKLLQWIEKGMHLTVSGDRNGIKLDKNANLLQLAMLASGWADNALLGGGAAQTTEVVADDSPKLTHQIKGFIDPQLRPSMFDAGQVMTVENRALQINSFEHIARTIKSFHHLAVALKAYQEHVSIDGSFQLNSIILTQLKEGKKLNEILEGSANILPNISDEKVRNMVITWEYFREKTIKAFAEKQKAISRYKLRNPLETYSGRDMTRLNAELFEVFGGVEPETGEMGEDALKSLHENPEEGSIPDEMRNLIIECRSVVDNTFKNSA